MPDKLFFPIAMLIAAMLVFVAIDPMQYRPPRGPVSGGGRNALDVTIQGEELHRFLPGKIGGIEMLEKEVPEAKRASTEAVRLQRLATQTYDNPQDGPHLVIAEDVEAAFSDRRIEVTIEARALSDIGASEFEANYMVEPGEESGWRRLPLTAEFEPHSFQWTVPRSKGVLGYDYLGVRPVSPTKRRSMEIRSIRLRVVTE